MCWDPDYDPEFDHDDLDPEGPSAADLARFDRAASTCPSCGSEVYDDATICPVCGEYILSHSSFNRKYLWPIVASIILIVFVLTWVL